MKVGIQMEYYDVLGLSKSANPEQIAKAFREVAFKYHPDRNPNDQEALKKFKLASEAFEVLSNHNKRVEYDAKGYVGRPPRNPPKRPKPKPKTEDSDVSWGSNIQPPIIVNQMSYFGGGMTGRNILAHVELSEDQLKKGGGYTIVIKKQQMCQKCLGDGLYAKACPRCNGRGRLGLIGSNFKNAGPICPQCDGVGTLEIKCNACRGVGRDVWANQTVRITLPLGCQSGHQITVHGEGEYAPGKLPGYLRVVCIQK